MKSDNWIMAKNFDTGLMATMIKTILEQSTAADIENGRQWYSTARKFAREQSEKHNLKIDVVTAVISALSPETTWQINKDKTIEFLEYRENSIMATYPNNKDKALKFLSNDLEPNEHYNLSNWRKTSAFYRNILEPNCDQRVTLDRHALRIAHGYYLTGDQSIYYGNTRAKYVKTELVFKQIAHENDMLPNVLQAITWVTFRRLFVGNGKEKRAKRANKEIIL